MNFSRAAANESGWNGWNTPRAETPLTPSTAMEIPKLSDDVVAVFRLPVPVDLITAICRMFSDKAHRLHQEGGWIVVTKEEGQ